MYLGGNFVIEKENNDNRNIRRASSIGIKIVIICGIFIIIGVIAAHLWGKPTTGTEAQIAVQNEAQLVYDTTQANVKTGTLLANGQIVTEDEFPELPVTIAANALYTSGQITNYSDISILTGGGVDPTMSQLETIINTKPYEIQVNSLGQLTAIPNND